MLNKKMCMPKKMKIRYKFVIIGSILPITLILPGGTSSVYFTLNPLAAISNAFFSNGCYDILHECLWLLPANILLSGLVYLALGTMIERYLFTDEVISTFEKIAYVLLILGFIFSFILLNIMGQAFGGGF
jgi:hypothetical protein